MNTKHALLVMAAAAFAASPATAQEAIKIGASLPLTGNFSVPGTKHQEGYELCVELINKKGGVLGRQMNLIISDNRSDTETALNQTERFVNVDKVDVIFGTFSSKLTFPVSSVIEKYGMINPVPSGGALRIWTRGLKHIFYFQQSAAEYIGSALQGLINERIPADQRPKTAAVVHADDFFANAITKGLLGQVVKSPGGGMVADLAPGYLKSAGVEVVYTETWPEEGFSDWLNLANSIKKSGAEMLAIPVASPEEAVQLTRALKTVNAPLKLLYVTQGTQIEYLEGAGKAADGVMMYTSWHPAAPFMGTLAGGSFSNADFQKAFAAKYGQAPDEDNAIPFAVCQGVEQAILGTGTTDNAKLSEWLHARTKENPVRTVLGDFSWDERGLPFDRASLMAQWQNGELKFIYPTDEFEGVSKLLYPKPAW